MSQHGRIISGEKSAAIIKRNPNGRICPVLAVFGIILGIANIIKFIDLSIVSLVPLTIMILLVSTINESILHLEVKSMRHILLLLLLFEAVWAGLVLFGMGILVKVFDFPILLAWGVFFYRIGSLFRCNSFLIWNEVLGNFIVILNWIAGILFFSVFFWEIGAFLGLVPPIPMIHTIAIFSACMTGIGIAVSFSSSFQFYNINKKSVRN